MFAADSIDSSKISRSSSEVRNRENWGCFDWLSQAIINRALKIRSFKIATIRFAAITKLVPCAKFKLQLQLYGEHPLSQFLRIDKRGDFTGFESTRLSIIGRALEQLLGSTLQPASARLLLDREVPTLAARYHYAYALYHNVRVDIRSEQASGRRIWIHPGCEQSAIQWQPVWGTRAKQPAKSATAGWRAIWKFGPE
jgi:hypothetical protein